MSIVAGTVTCLGTLALHRPKLNVLKSFQWSIAKLQWLLRLSTERIDVIAASPPLFVLFIACRIHPLDTALCWFHTSNDLQILFFRSVSSFMSDEVPWPVKFLSVIRKVVGDPSDFLSLDFTLSIESIGPVRCVFSLTLRTTNASGPSSLRFMRVGDSRGYLLCLSPSS